MARKTRKASKPRRGKPAGDGLKKFSIHATEARGSRMLGRLASERPGFRSFAAAGGADLTRLDPETAASRQLEQALESEALPQFTRPKGKNSSSEFKSLGSETVPLTNTTTVKFRQTFDKIPVYGSLVTVELDDKNECLAINSSLGEPKSVDPIASIAPAEALAAAAKRAGYPRGKAPDRTPNLYYYYDRAKGRWALAFIIENMPVKSPGRKGQLRPVIKDYVIDAHSGTVLAELPRTPSASAVQDSALDGLAKSRTFVCERNGAKKSLVNRKLNVLTYDFAFKDPQERDDLLPGALVRNPRRLGPPPR